MKNFIAIVSHGHENIIMNNKKLLTLLDEHTIIIKDNKSNKNLKTYCKNHNIIYLSTEKQMGFGENNNYIFRYCQTELNMKYEDYFVICNPDIFIDNIEFKKIQYIEKEKKYHLFTINLYNDSDFTKYDMNIRKFPSCMDFIKSFLFNNSYAYDKNQLSIDTTVDWCTGAFIVIKVKVYEKLQGFNESYFMYIEDLDLFRRAKKLQINLVYIPNIKAQHLFLRESKKILSKNFYWHIRSTIKYCFKYE